MKRGIRKYHSLSHAVHRTRCEHEPYFIVHGDDMLYWLVNYRDIAFLVYCGYEFIYPSFLYTDSNLIVNRFLRYVEVFPAGCRGWYFVCDLSKPLERVLCVYGRERAIRQAKLLELV